MFRGLRLIILYHFRVSVSNVPEGSSFNFAYILFRQARRFHIISCGKRLQSAISAGIDGFSCIQQRFRLGIGYEFHQILNASLVQMV